MLTDKTVLIVEDNFYLALDLSSAVEQLNGRVAGPVDSAADALEVLVREQVSGAILDCDLPDSDVAPVAKLLADRNLPFVIHASNHVDAALSLLRPGAPVLVKPIRPADVIAILAHEIIKAEAIR